MISLHEYKEMKKNLDALKNIKIDKLDFYNDIESCFYCLENKNFQCKKSENNGYDFIAYDPGTDDNLQVTFIIESSADHITLLEYYFHNLEVKTYGAELVAPERTESPLFYDIDLLGFETYEGFTLFGNRNFCERGANLEFIENLDNFYSDLSYFYEGIKEYENVNDIYDYYFSVSPTRQQKRKVWSILKNYMSKSTAEILPAVLSVLKNEPYRLTTLSGCMQSEWVHCLYPEKYESLIEQLEIEYFNTGSEWIITEPAGDTFAIYTGYEDRDAVAEILETDINDIYFKGEL